MGPVVSNVRPVVFFAAFVAALVALGLAWPARRQAHAQTRPPAPAAAGKLEITGPFAYENLSVFVLHDPAAKAAPEDVLTLEEGLAKGLVVVEETGEVNRLRVSNKGDKPVYLQAGDIVKGGQQDRTLQHDTMLPPRSRRVPLAAFCVEHGRWRKRGAEAADRFGSSANTVVTRKQKLAVKGAANQSEVWESVSEVQEALAARVGRSVKAPASESSLQLALEHGDVARERRRYVEAIRAQLPKRTDAVGYAFAVNGVLSAVDVYGSPALFRKLSDKLVEASAVEALAERRAGSVAKVSPDAVRAMMAEAKAAPVRAEASTGRAKVARGQSARTAVFTTDDADGSKIHDNYIAK
jgi:hypothetical protein